MVVRKVRGKERVKSQCGRSFTCKKCAACEDDAGVANEHAEWRPFAEACDITPKEKSDNITTYT